MRWTFLSSSESAIRPKSRWVLVAALALLTVGCATTRVTQTARSGYEQQLLVRSLERAVARLDLSRFTGKRVGVDLYALTPDQAFAKELVTSLLDARGIEVVSDVKKADLRLKILAPVLGVDRDEMLLGIPAFVAPVVAAPIPEIALFKWTRNRGHSEVEIFAYDLGTNRLIEVTPAGRGRSKFDEYTILLVIHFTRDDLDEPAKPPGR